MKLPRWMDRERRIHDLSVLLREKALASTMWFRQYQKLSAAVAIARAERDNAREDRGAAEASLCLVQSQLATRELELTNVRAAALAEREKLAERLAAFRAGRIVVDPRPIPTALALPDERGALYRLEAENARLRDENADLKRKYEGVPS